MNTSTATQAVVAAAFACEAPASTPAAKRHVNITNHKLIGQVIAVEWGNPSDNGYEVSVRALVHAVYYRSHVGEVILAEVLTDKGRAYCEVFEYEDRYNTTNGRMVGPRAHQVLNLEGAVFAFGMNE